ncbi:MAG: hypothetical protein ACFFCQ_05595 [Promethearchaeota archaeon]
MTSIFDKLVIDSNGYLEKIRKELQKEIQLHYWLFEIPPSHVLNDLIEIEKISFCPILRYTYEEFTALFDQNNPILMLITINEERVSFILCYQDPEDSAAMFIDSAASKVENREFRLVKLMVAILYIWGYYKGYNSVKLCTEDVNHLGVPLKKIWESQGFKEYHRDETGVYMEIRVYKELAIEAHLWIKGIIENVHG